MTSNYRSILMSRVKSNLGQNEPHSVSDFLLFHLEGKWAEESTLIL